MLVDTPETVKVIRRRRKEKTPEDLGIEYVEPETKSKVILRKRHRSMAETIADSDFCYLNFTVHQLKQVFPNSRDLFHVDYFFPYAFGGPLYIDTPKFAPQFKECEAKKIEMQKLNLRYLAIKPDMSLTDCQLEISKIPVLETGTHPVGSHPSGIKPLKRE